MVQPDPSWLGYIPRCIHAWRRSPTIPVLTGLDVQSNFVRATSDATTAPNRRRWKSVTYRKADAQRRRWISADDRKSPAGCTRWCTSHRPSRTPRPTPAPAAATRWGTGRIAKPCGGTYPSPPSKDLSSVVDRWRKCAPPPLLTRGSLCQREFASKTESRSREPSLHGGTRPRCSDQWIRLPAWGLP